MSAYALEQATGRKETLRTGGRRPKSGLIGGDPGRPAGCDLRASPNPVEAQMRDREIPGLGPDLVSILSRFQSVSEKITNSGTQRAPHEHLSLIANAREKV